MAISHLERVICGVIWYTMSGISLFCSLITPLIIFRMRNWNGTLLLVVALSLTLALYSLGLLLTAVNKSDVVCQIQGIIIFFSGISSALWTTCFSTTLLLLVSGFKFGGIQEVFKYYISASIGIPLILTIVGVSTGFVDRGYLSCFVDYGDRVDFNAVYDLVILVCVIYNLVFFIYCYNRIRQMGGSKSPTAIALKEACFRMIYYPLVQSVCWVFIWTRYFHSQNANQADPKRFVSLLLSTLSSPLFGFGMFLVFLAQQKKAKHILIGMLCPKCILSRFYKNHSETIMEHSSVDRYSSNSNSNKSTLARLGTMDLGTDPTRAETGTASIYDDDDDGIIQIHHDEDSESMYSATQSISMVSRPSQLDRSSTTDFSTMSANNSLYQNQENPILRESRGSNNIAIYNANTNNTTSTDGTTNGKLGGTGRSIRSPVQQKAMYFSNKDNEPQFQSQQQQSSQQQHSEERTHSITGRTFSSIFNPTSSLFGNSITSPSTSRQNSVRSPQFPFLGRTISSVQHNNSQHTSQTNSRTTSRTVSVDTNFSLLDELDLFRIIQAERTRSKEETIVEQQTQSQESNNGNISGNNSVL